MKFLTLMLLALMITACGKNVDTKNPTPKLPPIANPGIVVGNPLPGYIGSGKINLAYHEVSHTQQPTVQYRFPSERKIQLPSIIEVGFDTGDYDAWYKGSLDIFIDGSHVCTYFAGTMEGTMELEDSCKDQIFQVQFYDSLWVEGLSPREAIEFEYYYEQNN